MKYMGSKSRIAKYIVPIIQNYIDDNNIKCYVEPFAGGLNIFDKIVCDKKIAIDKHKYLIALFNYLKNGGELPNSVSKEEYSNVRSNNDGYEDWYVGCVGFLASYNGRWFDGGYAKPGFEKTKNGERYRDYFQESKKNLLEQFDNLKNDFDKIEFKNKDYTEFKNRNLKGYLIYADPPYKGTKEYSNSKDFNHDEFWDIMRLWSKDNIVLISEENAPDDFECIWEQEVSRSIKATDKSTSVEKLFKYKERNYGNISS